MNETGDPAPSKALDLSHHAALFAGVFEASPTPMVLVAADTPRFTIVLTNKAHSAALRRRPEDLLGRSLLDVIPVQGETGACELIEAVRASLQRALDTGEPSYMPPQLRAFGVRGESDAHYWSAIHTPLLGPDGRITHILSTVSDVTSEVLEERLAEARMLMMREIDHRARNTIAVVQSIVQMTDAEDQDSFKKAVQRRVAALARVQTSLASRKWEGADLRDVAEAELTALAAPGAFELAGPGVLLPADRVQALSMILHELATNAHKYGALSVAGGAVAVNWTVEDGRLSVVWSETGGPPVTAPGRSGFGSRLIDRLVRQLSGELQYDWRPDGLRATFSGPFRGRHLPSAPP